MFFDVRGWDYGDLMVLVVCGWVGREEFGEWGGEWEVVDVGSGEVLDDGDGVVRGECEWEGSGEGGLGIEDGEGEVEYGLLVEGVFEGFVMVELGELVFVCSS